MALSTPPPSGIRSTRMAALLINIAEAEMGQHVGTALARIVADELEADWSQVELHPYVDTDPKWGVMVTGGSWSVWQNFTPMSHAGAAGRIALIEEGAKLLARVSADQCQARNSRVIAGDPAPSATAISSARATSAAAIAKTN